MLHDGVMFLGSLIKNAIEVEDYKNAKISEITYSFNIISHV